MLKLFKRTKAAPAPARTFSIPAGQRVYAIGDVHGCLAELTDLVATIEADDAARGGADTTIIFLGDLVDRGPDSAGVVSAARNLSQRRRVRLIAGNHEEMFLKSLDSIDVLRHFSRYGGRETALSYGVSAEAYGDLTFEELQAELRRRVPAEDIAFMAGFEDLIVIGDYAFVHAGIKPGVPLSEQSTRDLRWIREPFLSTDTGPAARIVHGHTITAEPELRPHRIGVDTGAYQSGRLSAVGLEGEQVWFLSASTPSRPGLKD